MVEDVELVAVRLRCGNSHFEQVSELVSGLSGAVHFNFLGLVVDLNLVFIFLVEDLLGAFDVLFFSLLAVLTSFAVRMLATFAIGCLFLFLPIRSAISFLVAAFDLLSHGREPEQGRVLLLRECYQAAWL